MCEHDVWAGGHARGLTARVTEAPIIPAGAAPAQQSAWRSPALPPCSQQLARTVFRQQRREQQQPRRVPAAPRPLQLLGSAAEVGQWHSLHAAPAPHPSHVCNSADTLPCCRAVTPPSTRWCSHAAATRAASAGASRSTRSRRAACAPVQLCLWHGCHTFSRRQQCRASRRV